MRLMLLAMATIGLLPGCSSPTGDATQILWAASSRCGGAPVKAQVTEVDGEMLFEARCKITQRE